VRIYTAADLEEECKALRAECNGLKLELASLHTTHEEYVKQHAQNQHKSVNTKETLSESESESRRQLTERNKEEKSNIIQKSESNVVQSSAADKETDPSSHEALRTSENKVCELRALLLQAQHQLKQKEDEFEKFKVEQESLEATRQSDLDVVSKHIMKMQKEYQSDMESMRSEKEALCEQHNREMLSLQKELELLRIEDNARERGQTARVKHKQDSDSGKHGSHLDMSRHSADVSVLAANQETDACTRKDDSRVSHHDTTSRSSLELDVSRRSNSHRSHDVKDGELLHEAAQRSHHHDAVVVVAADDDDVDRKEQALGQVLDVSASSHRSPTRAHTSMHHHTRDTTSSRHADANMSDAMREGVTRIYTGFEGGRREEDSRHTDLNASMSSQRSGTHGRQSDPFIIQDMLDTTASSFSPTRSNANYSRLEASMEVQALLGEISTSRDKHKRRIQTCQNETDLLRRQYEMKVVKLQQEMDELSARHAAQIRDRDAQMYRLSMQHSASANSRYRDEENHHVGADEGRTRVKEHHVVSADEGKPQKCDTCIPQDDQTQDLLQQAQDSLQQMQDSLQHGCMRRDADAPAHHDIGIQVLNLDAYTHDKIARIRMCALNGWSRSLQRFLMAKLLLHWCCNVRGRMLARCKNRAAEVRAFVFVFMCAYLCVLVCTSVCTFVHISMYACISRKCVLSPVMCKQ
jgi:hypothetical protein